MARQTLVNSIEALQNETFTCASGFSYDVYLDPEAEKIYTFLNSNAVPVAAYHKIDLRILTLNNGAIPESVYSALKEVEDNLDTLINHYKGAEWDGSNHKGQWEPEAFNLLEYLQQKDFEIGYYWEPEDWFEPVLGSLRQQWEDGSTAEEIVDREGCGTPVDGMVDRDAAIEWLEEQIREWEEA